MDSATSAYRAVLQLVNCKFSEIDKVNLCGLCFNALGDDSVELGDEIAIDERNTSTPLKGIINAIDLSTEQMSRILENVLGGGVLETIEIFKGICKPCTRSTLDTYKFIKKCAENIEQFNRAIENLSNCFNNTTDEVFEYKTVYVSINTETLITKQVYDSKRQPRETALARFHFLTNGQHNKATSKGLPKKKRRKERDFSTIFIKTHELMYEPHSGKFKCKLCLKEYPNSGSLRLHFFSCHFKKEFKCQSCPKSFGTAGLLNTHERECHCTIECIECGKRLLNRTSTIKRHHLIHIKKVEKICGRCGRSYKKKTDFERHLAQDTCDMPSRVPGNYICDLCGKLCHFKHQLLAHMRFEHGNAKGHVCKWCGRKCYNESALKTHVLKHTGEKNFVCLTCGGKFVTRQSLVHHTRLHTGETPYPCQFCEKKFLSASRRKEHVERDHMDASYECDLCDAKYNARRSLAKHRKTHFTLEQV